jgi:hypothetical protein
MDSKEQRKSAISHSPCQHNRTGLNLSSARSRHSVPLKLTELLLHGWDTLMASFRARLLPY